MARTDLTAQRVREILEYNPDTGAFIWRQDQRCGHKTGNQVRRLAGLQAGSCNKVSGYIIIGIGGSLYLAHRLAWLYVHGSWPEQQIDHIDGDRKNNRIANLRDVSPAINSENQRKPPRSKSNQAPLGAHWKESVKLWASSIQANGKLMHLGYFKSADAAHEAYVIAKRQLHAGCTI